MKNYTTYKSDFKSDAANICKNYFPIARGSHLRLLQSLDHVLHVLVSLLQQSCHEQRRGALLQQPEHGGHVAVRHDEVEEPRMPGHGEALPEDVPEGRAGAGEGGLGSAGGRWRPA